MLCCGHIKKNLFNSWLFMAIELLHEKNNKVDRITSHDDLLVRNTNSSCLTGFINFNVQAGNLGTVV